MKTLKELIEGIGNNVAEKVTGQHGDKNIAVIEFPYQCPMKCEGAKIYRKPGNCPECNMKLVPVSSKTSHDHHNHKHGCC